jgi:photosystem II PsbZ protein
MIVLFNLALFGLVLLSFVMIVGVPVAYAAPQNWDRSKQLLYIGSGAWTLSNSTVGCSSDRPKSLVTTNPHPIQNFPKSSPRIHSISWQFLKGL